MIIMVLPLPISPERSPTRSMPTRRQPGLPVARSHARREVR